MKNSQVIKKPQGFSGTTSTSVSEQIMQWYLKLGHPSFPYLKHLFPKLFRGIDCSMFQCERCHLSNDHCVAFVSKLIVRHNHLPNS